MERLFDTFERALECIRRQHLASVQPRNVNLHGVEVLAKLHTFSRAIQASEEIHIVVFCDHYYYELKNMKQILSNSAESDVRNLVNRIFIHELRFHTRQSASISNLFLEFIKGITFFSDEMSAAHPIYHRLASCGPKANNDTHRIKNLICKTSDSSQSKYDKRQSVYKCYVERLIYDKIILHHTMFFPEELSDEHKQDSPHINRLESTKRDFQTCFPNQDISVHVEFGDRGHPLSAHISHARNGTVTHTESYHKTYHIDRWQIFKYQNTVDCFKIRGDHQWYKLQTFRKPVKWIRSSFAKESIAATSYIMKAKSANEMRVASLEVHSEFATPKPASIL